ncbi:MAG: dephospho-CoA kinase [Ignavibacteriae bacterium]|nr:dephospho-CoA kinase [Ignavibacteriota bacterium]MCB0723133.1 dephospho-CoA kinase [Ignavibacteriota bacterium]MCB9242979.1 dephospho-CoA kinase [Ignavibacteriales bacterium]
MHTIKDKVLVGITGGIGSGKTEVCRVLEKEGFKVLYADQMAKDLYTTDKKLNEKIVKMLGKKVLNFKNKISLSKLKKEIFSNEKIYKKFTHLVHPVVIEALKKEIKSMKGEKIVLIETALAFESGMDKDLDYVIMVYSNKKNRMARIRLRDESTYKEIETIMHFQMDEKEKIEKSDFVIVNNKTQKDLDAQTIFIGKVLKALKKRKK